MTIFLKKEKKRKSWERETQNRSPCEHGDKNEMMYLPAKEYQGSWTAPRSQKRSMKHILQEALEGTNPTDLGFRLAISWLLVIKCLLFCLPVCAICYRNLQKWMYLPPFSTEKHFKDTTVKTEETECRESITQIIWVAESETGSQWGKSRLTIAGSHFHTRLEK